MFNEPFYLMLCFAAPWIAVAFSSIFIGEAAILLAAFALFSNIFVSVMGI